MDIRKEEDPTGDAASEPASSHQGDERSGPGAGEHGTAGEKDYCRHQKDGQGRADGLSLCAFENNFFCKL